MTYGIEDEDDFDDEELEESDNGQGDKFRR